MYNSSKRFLTSSLTTFQLLWQGLRDHILIKGSIGANASNYQTRPSNTEPSCFLCAVLTITFSSQCLDLGHSIPIRGVIVSGVVLLIGICFAVGFGRNARDAGQSPGDHVLTRQLSSTTRSRWSVWLLGCHDLEGDGLEGMRSNHHSGTKRWEKPKDTRMSGYKETEPGGARDRHAFLL